MRSPRASRPAFLRRVQRGVLALACAGAAGCGAGEPFLLEVGTGIIDFVPVNPTDELRMTCGSQGGQHIWVSIRTTNAGGRARRVTFSIEDEAGQPLCGLDFRSADLAEKDGIGGITGMLCVINDVAAADGKSVRLKATVIDAHGRSASDERPFIARAPVAPCR